MNRDERIRKLEKYKGKLLEWRRTADASVRSFINQNTVWVRREVIEARCYHTLTVGPPPAIGGLVMRNIDPFGMMFEPPWNLSPLPDQEPVPGRRPQRAT